MSLPNLVHQMHNDLAVHGWEEKVVAWLFMYHKTWLSHYFYSDSSWLLDTLLIFLYVSYVADYSDYEDSSLEFLERCSSPLTRSSGSSLALRSMFTEKNTTYQYPRAILSVDLSGESMCNHVMLKTSLKILKCGTENKTYFNEAYLSRAHNLKSYSMN